MKVMVIGSDAAVHGPAGSSVVRVNVTDPATLSAAPGVYVAFSRVASLKVPSPDVVHVEEDAPPPIAPASAKVPLWQPDWSAFASAVGGACVVIVNEQAEVLPFTSVAV